MPPTRLWFLRTTLQEITSKAAPTATNRYKMPSLSSRCASPWRPDLVHFSQSFLDHFVRLTAPGTVLVNGAGTVYQYSAPAGVSAFQVPMNVGTQAFSLVRNGATVMSATSLRPIINGCPCGWVLSPKRKPKRISFQPFQYLQLQRFRWDRPRWCSRCSRSRRIEPINCWSSYLLRRPTDLHYHARHRRPDLHLRHWWWCPCYGYHDREGYNDGRSHHDL